MSILMHRTAFPIALLLKCLAGIALCQNIDTEQPILREVSGLENGSLFGYSLVLHQTATNPSSVNETIDGVR